MVRLPRWSGYHTVPGHRTGPARDTTQLGRTPYAPQVFARQATLPSLQQEQVFGDVDAAVVEVPGTSEGVVFLFDDLDGPERA